MRVTLCLCVYSCCACILGGALCLKNVLSSPTMLDSSLSSLSRFAVSTRSTRHHELFSSPLHPALSYSHRHTRSPVDVTNEFSRNFLKFFKVLKQGYALECTNIRTVGSSTKWPIKYCEVRWSSILVSVHLYLPVGLFFLALALSL